MSSKNDPIHTPIQIRLEALNARTAAITMGANGRPVVWWYDPKNRIHSPVISSYPDLGSLLADMCVFLSGAIQDDPVVEKQLARALEIAAIQRLEFKALALTPPGGYTTADPAEKDFDNRRLSPDATRAALCRDEAKRRRAVLDVDKSTKEDVK